MKTLVKTLALRGNPFEHYTAETEPEISSYAVRPPYLQAISDRVNNLSSFILFGDRGAGKSATRITIFNEAWQSLAKASGSGQRHAFIVNLTDFSSIQDAFKKDRLNERDLVRVVAFFVIEQTLAWLSSLEDDERAIFISGLDKTERTLALAMIKGFYLSVNELDRMVSTTDALRLLNSAWATKSKVWAAQRWDALSKILAAAANALSKRTLDDDADISAPAEALLKSLVGDAPNAPRAILLRLVEFVQLFGFSGVAVLVDKVDETPATSNSAEATARLIYPLLAHTQLLEVPGFSWTMFLWQNVKDHFHATKYPVRLDKLAHANISWTKESLREMIEARISFFSNSRSNFSNLFDDETSSDDIFESIVSLAVNSPRELIKLMDTIVREHDALGNEASDLIERKSVEAGTDKYVVETIGGFFKERPLQQVLRLGKLSFVNRDVQFAFKIGDQGARVKIKSWEDAGLVRQSGTQASEVGAKQAYRFVVADARVARIIDRKLVDFVGAGAEADDVSQDELDS